MTFKDGSDIVKKNLVNLSNWLDNIEKNTQDRFDEIEVASHNRYDLIEVNYSEIKNLLFPIVPRHKNVLNHPQVDLILCQDEHHASKKIKIVDKYPFSPIIHLVLIINGWKPGTQCRKILLAES
ncbi:hypothetical protein K3495_g1158 [Podosphaera aphanis]|nr:hypothetical protein K3495_g1158 [Podosphaera aphanis]